MKTCFRCHVSKPLTAFYPHPAMKDGHLNKCKACALAEAKAHRLANIDRLRAYDLERASDPGRIANSTEQTRRWRAVDPRRAKAHSAVASALRRGALRRDPCHVCGSEKSVAHHPDYSAPLAVVWLCQPHHKSAHAISLPHHAERHP